jgi:hypothetical protein
MRLINCETNLFEEFFDKNVPRYAILSHTWNDAEVSFRDYYNPQRHALYSAEANDKITRTCEKAKEDGYGYVWIDSCVIDKSSSAELTEAINSMHKWYEGAERCYVYLSDFEIKQECCRLCEVELEALATCKWFTRGWGKCIIQDCYA